MALVSWALFSPSRMMSAMLLCSWSAMHILSCQIATRMLYSQLADHAAQYHAASRNCCMPFALCEKPMSYIAINFLTIGEASKQSAWCLCFPKVNDEDVWRDGFFASQLRSFAGHNLRAVHPRRPSRPRRPRRAGRPGIFFFANGFLGVVLSQ